MGTWGYAPYDNDTAADWFFNLNDIGLFDLIEKGLNSEWDEEVRAAAWLFSRVGESAYVYNLDKMDEHRELAVNKLGQMLNDEEWVNKWDKPDLIKKALTRQIEEVKYYRNSGPFKGDNEY